MSDPVVITASSQAGIVWMRVSGAPSVLFQNLDTTTTIYLGTKNTISPASPNTVVLGPGQSMQLDGTKTWWAISLVPALLNVIPGGIAVGNAVTQISGPVTATIPGTVNVAGSVAISSGTVDIATTAPIDVSAATVGVAPQANIQPIFTSAAITPGSGFGTGFLNVPSYAQGYSVKVTSAIALATLACDVTVSHFDNNNNVLLSEWYTVQNWSQLGSCTLRGPVFGTKITVQVVNATSTFLNGLGILSGQTAQNVTFTVSALPIYVPDISRKPPTSDSGHPLGILSRGGLTAIPASASTLLDWLTDFIGQVLVTVRSNTAAPFSGIPFINTYTVTNGTGSVSTIQLPAVSGVGNVENVPLYLDGGLHQFGINNTTATAGQASWNITALLG